jgi:hypothetical protein
MQQWGVNYWETYAPVVNWISVRFLLILSKIVGLESRAIDFVLVFPQAKLDVPVYTELPIGMEVKGDTGERRMKVLCLKKSLYGLKQASANWHDMLKRGLELRGFEESIADPCVFIFKDQDNPTKHCLLKDKTFKPNPLEGRKTQKAEGNSVHVTNESLAPIKASFNSIRDFKESTAAIIVLVYVDNCIILSRDQLLIQKFTDSLQHGQRNLFSQMKDP